MRESVVLPGMCVLRWMVADLTEKKLWQGCFDKAVASAVVAGQ